MPLAQDQRNIRHVVHAGLAFGSVVQYGPANHFKGIESKFNVQSHDESFPVESIASVEPSRTLGIVPNGVLVHLRDGRRERFVVGGRSALVTHLRNAR
jgi:hypothetical protein